MLPKFDASFVSRWKLGHSLQIKIEVGQLSQYEPEIVNFTFLIDCDISKQDRRF